MRLSAVSTSSDQDDSSFRRRAARTSVRPIDAFLGSCSSGKPQSRECLLGPNVAEYSSLVHVFFVVAAKNGLLEGQVPLLVPRFRVVCTENLNTGVVVMKSAQD